MKYRELHSRLHRLESAHPKRNKPWIIELEYGEPAPCDTENVLVIIAPPGWKRTGPAEGPSEWNYYPNIHTEK